MHDIESRNDIELLINNFYQRALTDDKLGFIFTDIAKINLETHIPIICNFWEVTIFQTGIYKNNPIKVHHDLNLKVKLTKDHFDRWLHLFCETVDSLFEGINSDLIKTRALSIATVMQIKISQ